MLAWFWRCKSSSATCKHQGTQLLHALKLWHSALTKMAISHWQQNSRSDHSALLHKGSVALYLLTLKPGQQTRELIRLWRLKTAGSLALQTALQTVNRTRLELSCDMQWFAGKADSDWPKIEECVGTAVLYVCRVKPHQRNSLRYTAGAHVARAVGTWRLAAETGSMQDEYYAAMQDSVWQQSALQVFPRSLNQSFPDPYEQHTSLDYSASLLSVGCF